MVSIKMFLIFPVISSIVCAFILIYILINGDKNLKLLSFELMIGCCFVWSFGQVLEYSTSDLFLLSIYTKIIHTAVAFIGTMCLIFSLYCTESVFVYKYKRFIPSLFIIPVFTFIMVLSNEFHGLYYFIYPDPKTVLKRTITLGPLFWLIYFYTIIFTIIAIGIIIKAALNSVGKIKAQMIFVAMIMIAPIIVNTIEISLNLIINRDGHPFDLTPTSFAFSCLFAFLAAFRYNFLNIMPIAHKIVFDHLEHGTLVYNKLGKLIKYNSSFDKSIKYFIDPESDISTYQKFCNVLKESVCSNGDSLHQVSETFDTCQNEIMLKSKITGEVRIYEMFVQPIFNSSNHYLGKIITFHDITRHKTLVDEVNEKNKELTSMNKKLVELNRQLNEKNKLVKKLAISDERNRIARELHDSIGHTLMLIIMLMKVVKIEYDTNPQPSKDKVAEAINIAEDGFREIKRLINGFLSDNIKNRNIIYNLENLFNDVRLLGIEINFSVIDKECFYNMADCDENIKLNDTIYKICKEALTNSIRHGKASSVNIILKHTLSNINIYIIDNGKGCKDIKEGLGINGIKDRVKGLHGNIVYGSDGESGFNIFASIPFECQNHETMSKSV